MCYFCQSRILTGSIYERMKYKRLIYSTSFFVILALLAILASVGYKQIYEQQAQDFDAERFKEVGFTPEEFDLFCDIGFKHERKRVMKWETDIKVQIMNIKELDRQTISEVDSAIAIIAPLIAPLKIERVSSGGNLFIFRNVRIIPSTRKPPDTLKGLTQINPESMYSWSIEQAYIYDRYHSDGLTLMHELEHALGLNHPTKIYSSALTIGWGTTSQLFKPEEWYAYKKKKYRLTDLEKKVIRMLYSPEIKSGLSKDVFMKKMMGVE